MTEFITDLEELVDNVEAYQEAVARYRGFKPSVVKGWYFVPSLGMAAASRFIGYAGMTGERYLYDMDKDGRETEIHLKELGWFEPLPQDDPRFEAARGAVLQLTGKIHKGARFHVLKQDYDQEVAELLEDR